MEALVRSFDPWCSRSQAYSSIDHLQLHGLRSSLCSQGFHTWPAFPHPPNPRASFNLRIGSTAFNRFSARFNIKSLLNSESSHVCRGSRPKENNEETSPEGDADQVSDAVPVIRNEDSFITGSKDARDNDWRSFRARLVKGEQAESTRLEDSRSHESLPKAFSKKWAHPIPFPETGCLLVATDKLDGQAPFERSVILLLRLGSPKPQDGPFGVILNRPILHMAKESGPVSERMEQMLQNCRVFYGGPLPADIFLLMQMAEGFNHLEEIMPGVYYGYAHGLQQMPDLRMQDKILNDFRFYVGYAGWDFNQLKEEIAEGFWWVASCSPDLVKEVQSDLLWQEVLSTMGGEYAKIGRKSRGDTQ